MELDDIAQKQQATQHETEDKADDKQEHRKTKTDAKNYVIVALSTALIVIGLMWIRDAWASGTPSAALIPSTAPLPSAAAVVDMKALVDNDPALGNKNAPVTMIEFSDYQCPFCGRFFTQTLPLIKTNYIDTGKVRFVYRDFPLDNIHSQATPAAIAANCAGEQGNYFGFHDKIFQNQQILSGSVYKQWAGELGLNVGQWEACTKDPQQLQEVRKDFVDGSVVGVQGTPAFFINGQMVSGAQPYTVFEQIIDGLLAGG